VKDLFQAGAGGSATYRIPGIVVTKAGTILAYCEARKSGTGDWAEIDVMLRRSTDGGSTWEEPRLIATAPPNAGHNPAPVALKLKESGKTTNNPVAIADPVSGTVHFLYCVNYARCFYMRSDDDGRTFSQPVGITAAFESFRPKYNWKVIATGPGHGIRMTSGRLLVPVWMSLGTGSNGHHPSCVATIYSDDDGKNWRAGQIVVDDSPETPNPNETVVSQLDDGGVMLNIRNESPKNRRLVTTSPSGAADWSEPKYDDALFDPICFASLLAIQGKGQLLFCNPDSSTSGGKSLGKPRKNLTVRLSDDGGKSWPISRVIEPGIAGYCDLAASPDGTTIYCLFERGGLKGNMFHTEFLSLARFPISWLKSGNATP
jgi:sialidase-1